MVMRRSGAERVPTNPLLLAVLAVVGAIAADCAVWAVVHLAAGVDLEVRLTPGAHPEQVGIAAVAFAVALAGVVAALLVAVLRRRARRPRRVWLLIALVVLVVSLAGPLGAAQTAPAMLSLISLHLVAAAVLIPVLFWSLPRYDRRVLVQR